MDRGRQGSAAVVQRLLAAINAHDLEAMVACFADDYVNDAMLTHGNMVANVLQAMEWISPKFPREPATLITALPLYHIFALTANCFTFFQIGAKNVLIANPRDIPGFIKEIAKYL